MAEIQIRPYRPEDRPAIRAICFDTGLQGESIASQYADRESFADMFTAHFTDNEPELVVVAELEGRVIGYMCAALDVSKARSPESYALKQVFTRGVCFRPGTAGFYWRSAFDVIGGAFSSKSKPKLDYKRFPSTNHINLLAEARGGGTAFDLFFTAVDGLKERGSPGMHAEALASNKAVAEFITRKLGGEKFGDPYLLPGLRDKDGGRIEAQMFVLDLANYKVGDWKRIKAERAAKARAAR
ncbi:MAG: hypothetical protein QM778_29280 [Myxococcales bacterium]